MKHSSKGLLGLLSSDAHASEAYRYVAVGVVSALSHLLLAASLISLGGLGPSVASSLAFLAVAAGAFFAQHSWVFRAEERLTKTAPRYASVVVVAFTVNLGTVHLGTTRTGAHYIVVQGVAFVLIPIANYLAHKLWSFRSSGSR